MSNNGLFDSREELSDGYYVRLSGDIDMSRSPEIRNELLGIVGEDCDRLVVDMTDVPYIDSSAVATFVEVLQYQRDRERKMVLCGLSRRVLSILQIVRLDRVFTIAADVESGKSV